MLSHSIHHPAGTPVGMIVALHGIMEDGGCLTRVAKRWSGQGWTVLVPDLRGHGRSPRWLPDELEGRTGDRIVDDVVELIGEYHSPGPLVVFGHSAGGATAAGLAGRDAPITGLLLEDPFWRLPVTSAQDPEVARAAYTELLQWQAMDSATLQAQADPRWDAEEAQRWARAKRDADPAIILHGTVIPTTPWPDLLTQARERGIAVHVVTGTDRTGITPEHQQLITGAGGSVTVIEGASHFVQRTATAEFDAFADRALATMAGGAA